MSLLLLQEDKMHNSTREPGKKHQRLLFHSSDFMSFSIHSSRELKALLNFYNVWDYFNGSQSWGAQTLEFKYLVVQRAGENFI